MNCPVCDEKMREINRHGVDIDICPSCKGVWLDRGELEKILEMAGSREAEVAEPRRDAEPTRQEPERRREYDDEHDRRDHGREEYRGERRDEHDPRRRRKGSWLSDILEGFGGGD